MDADGRTEVLVHGGSSRVNCPRCGGPTVAGVRAEAGEHGGERVLVRDVPVAECQECGEVSLDAEVARQLARIFRQMLETPGQAVTGYVPPAA
jgi:YgiT-type zinc finger domain-containing protein